MRRSLLHFSKEVNMTALSYAELPILDWLQAIRNPVFDVLAQILDVINGHGEMYILICALLLLYKPTRKAGMICATALIFDYLLVNMTLKPLVARIRPYDLNPLVTLIVDAPHDFSFPSGHTAVSFAFAAAAACMGKKAHTLSLAFACLMGVSRMYLYVHYPTDVLAGAFFGTLCGLLALFLWKKIIGRDKI